MNTTICCFLQYFTIFFFHLLLFFSFLIFFFLPCQWFVVLSSLYSGLYMANSAVCFHIMPMVFQRCLVYINFISTNVSKNVLLLKIYCFLIAILQFLQFLFIYFFFFNFTTKYMVCQVQVSFLEMVIKHKFYKDFKEARLTQLPKSLLGIRLQLFM